MIPMTLADVATCVEGTLVGADAQTVVTQPLAVDSRLVQPGGLFVAMVGEHVDGHRFAADAIAAGAVAIIAQHPLDHPCIVVDDTLRAVAALASQVRQHLTDVAVIGITGSSGKTGTKDLIAAALGEHLPTVCAKGSFNNELGVPLTISQVDPHTRRLVLEMGARHQGDIEYLSDIAKPTVGVVVNVGLAHVGEFGDRERVAQAKSELVRALPPANAGGVAVLNADDPYVLSMIRATDAHIVLAAVLGPQDTPLHGPRVVRSLTGRSGEPETVDITVQVWAHQVNIDHHGRASFILGSSLASAPGTAEVHLSLVGAHHVTNAVLAAAVALVQGETLDQVAQRLSQATAQNRWRMEMLDRPDGVLVINDAYNANPDSMAAALDSLGHFGRDGRRTIAVLGEMLELGDVSQAEHAALGTYAAQQDVSLLVCVGPALQPAVAASRRVLSWLGQAVYVENVEQARAFLDRHVRSGDVVLFKSSRDSGLRYLGDAIAGMHEPPAHDERSSE